MITAVQHPILGSVQGNQRHLGRDRRLPARGPSLLIVDSLSFLVSPVMGPGGTDDGHALMICLGRALKQLAQKHKLAVISTNHIVGGASPPALHLSRSALERCSCLANAISFSLIDLGCLPWLL